VTCSNVLKKKSIPWYIIEKQLSVLKQKRLAYILYEVSLILVVIIFSSTCEVKVVIRTIFWC